MKPNKLSLTGRSIFLVICACAFSNAAYAEGKKLEKGVPHVVALSNFSHKPLRDIDIKFSGKDSADFSQTNNCGKKLDEDRELQH